MEIVLHFMVLHSSCYVPFNVCVTYEVSVLGSKRKSVQIKVWKKPSGRPAPQPRHICGLPFDSKPSSAWLAIDACNCLTFVTNLLSGPQAKGSAKNLISIYTSWFYHVWSNPQLKIVPNIHSNLSNIRIKMIILQLFWSCMKQVWCFSHCLLLWTCQRELSTPIHRGHIFNIKKQS